MVDRPNRPPGTKATSSIEDWTKSDLYHNSFLIKPDAGLNQALASSQAEGLPPISVSNAQGKFLHLLLRTFKAARVLEIGTLGGYSAIWFAKALPDDGEVVSLEIDAARAEIAQRNVSNAGLSNKVKIIVGPAIESMPKLEPPFDFVFIDADKESNLEYFLEAKRLVKSGGVIIVDNVVRFGGTADLECHDSRVEGVRRLLRHLKDDTDVDCTTIATVGEKGYDGFLYALRL